MPQETKLCITGTTGGLGSRVLHHLLTTLNIPGDSLILSLHNPRGLPSSLQTSGLDIRHGDFTNPSTLRTAFRGATKLLLISYPSIAHSVRVEAHKNAIDAAVQEGVRHVYYTSLAFAGDSKAAVMQAHLDTEEYLKGCGVAYTIIREGIYNESYPLYLGFFDPGAQADVEKREVLVPGDGKVAWVARDDLGEGTARILVDESDGYRNETVLLSGAVPMSMAELGRAVSEVMVWDPPLRVKNVSADEYVDYHTILKHGRPNVPEYREFLRLWSTTYPALAVGECAKVDPLLRELLGRELKTMKQTLEEELRDVRSAGVAVDQYAK